MSQKRASYAGEYFDDSRNIILAYCTRGTLAALTTTAKAVTAEAEAVLYEVVSLHEARADELSGCLRTLTGSQSSRKARLVRTFAVTFVQDRNSKERKGNRKHVKLLLGSIQLALPHMPGLKMLSVWAPKDVDTIAIEQVLRQQHFQLERLYINIIEDFTRLLECQPHLEVIGLWFTWRYRDDSHLDEKRAEMKRALARLRVDTYTSINSPSSTLLVQEQRCRASPTVFGIEDDDNLLRSLTIFDSPRMYCQCKAGASIGVTSEVARAPRHWQPLFSEGRSRNDLLCKYVREDLKSECGPDRDENLCFLLPEMSPAHITWAMKTFSQLVGMYPMDDVGDTLPFVTLFVVHPAKSSIDMEAVYEPFKKIIATLIDAEVGELEIRQYFQGTSNSAIGYQEWDTEVLFQKFSSIVREAVDQRQGKKGRFWFEVEEVENRFPFP